MINNKVLYVEDIKECYEKTKSAIGKKFEIDWKTNYADAFISINKNLEQYSAGIFDINLGYNSSLPNNLQTTEGFDLIKRVHKERKNRNLHFPIICTSSNGNYKEKALKSGADLFLWKKEFWENGQKILEELIEKV